ncbi:MAG: septum formation protein Maf [Verrucomicrobia bacterium]|nr:septum formation protein Maf [Verrucomicrobiota bacterium]
MNLPPAAGTDPKGPADEPPLPDLPPIILASASPRRRELLARLGVRFEVVPGHAEEAEHDELTGRELCLLNAHRKARVVAKHHPDHLVIGADTVVYLGTRSLGKPVDDADARRMLALLSGETHQVLTGVCLLHLRGHRERLFADVTEVTFRSLSPEAIAAYVAAVQTLDKAGAYAIQERGEELVAGIQGSHSNVVGLPLERLRAELLAWPWE